MARCGCAGATCNCVVTAGTGTTVTGAGTPANPYVVSAEGGSTTEADTNTVDMSVLGSGTMADPYVISASVKLDPAAGNLITIGPGGLRVDCATIAASCGITPTAVDDTDSVDLTLTGSTITADIIPDPAGPVKIGPTGVTVCLSTDANNELVLGTDGCLYAPKTAVTAGTNATVTGTGTVADPYVVSATGGGTPVTTADTNTVNLSAGTAPLTADVIIDPAAGNILTSSGAGLKADIITDCGLTGEGTAASPLKVNIGANSFAADFPGCTPADGQKIYCDTATGQLHGVPCTPVQIDTSNVDKLPTNPAGDPVPNGIPTAIAQADVVGSVAPGCSASQKILRIREIEVQITVTGIPDGTRIRAGIQGDEMTEFLNQSGATANDVHMTQVTKVLTDIVAPGTAVPNLSMDVGETGVGGSVWTRAQQRYRVTYVPLPC